jgi:hypothetical protein
MLISRFGIAPHLYILGRVSFESRVFWVRTRNGKNAELSILQSIFGPALRRERLWQHVEGDRRDGGLKMGWTKPVPSAWPYGY